MDNNDTKTDFQKLVPKAVRSFATKEGQLKKEQGRNVAAPKGEGRVFSFFGKGNEQKADGRRPRQQDRPFNRNAGGDRRPQSGGSNRPAAPAQNRRFDRGRPNPRAVMPSASLQMQPVFTGSAWTGSGFKKEFGDQGVLRLLPLGGIGNVNKNMYVYEFGEDILLIDCGMGFPEDDMLGVDFLIPDITYLRDKIDRIKALVITHGHDDHIGAVSLLWRELKCPVYASRITNAFLKVKLAEHGLPIDMLHDVNPDEKLSLGSFEVNFVRLSHSVPDTMAVVIDTPIGRVVHSADFKFDWTPTVGWPTDVQKLAYLGYEGVSLLLSDSLGAEKPGYTLSERVIEPQLHEVARKSKGKIIVTTTSSNISRIQMAMNVALAHGRKVAVSGRSMDQNIGTSRNLGYLTYPEDLFVDLEQIERYKDNELMLIVAGSQGQAESSLARAAYDDHRFIKIKPGDAVVFSTDPIPGNENQTNRLIDQLFARGAEVYYSHVFDKLHVSGHAASEELKLMVGLVRPEVLLPIGGTERSTKKYVELAKDLGYEEHKVYLPQNGDIMEFSRVNGKFVGKVAGRVALQAIMVDGLGVGDLTEVVLRDRQVMSQDGILLVIIPVDSQTKQIEGGFELVSRGFVVMKESQELLDQLNAQVEEIIDPFRSKPFDWQTLRKRIDDRLSKYIFKELKRKPMVLPVLFEI